MKLLFNCFPLFRGKYMSIATVDYRDSMIVPRGASDMLSWFFDVDISMSSWWTDMRHKIDKYWCVDNYNLVYRDRVLATGVRAVDIAHMLVIKGYLLLYFKIVDNNTRALLVVKEKGYDFVGFITSSYETISSAELSHLIMSTPELDWRV